MGTALVLQALPGVFALDHERHFVQAVAFRCVGGEHLEAPTPTLGVVAVHVEQHPCEQVGFLAPFGPADLDDHIAAVIGVPGQQQEA